MAARAWPPSVALSSLTGYKTGRTSAAERVSVVAAGALGELLVSLLRLVEAGYAGQPSISQFLVRLPVAYSNPCSYFAGSPPSHAPFSV